MIASLKERKRNNMTFARQSQNIPFLLSRRRRTISAFSAFRHALYALNSSSHIFALFSPCAAAPACVRGRVRKERNADERAIEGAEASTRDRVDYARGSGIGVGHHAHANAFCDTSAHPDASASFVTPAVCIPMAQLGVQSGAVRSRVERDDETSGVVEFSSAARRATRDRLRTSARILL